jgi:outer membrane immunogenic protein
VFFALVAGSPATPFVEVGMRTILGAALWLATASVAVAADFPAQTYYSAPASSAMWAGPYLGANAGYQWGWVDNNPTKPSGVFAGVQGGYNWQRGQFVFGAETDIQISGADDTFAPWQFSNPWFGTLRGRGGVAFGNVLLYGTAGLAYGDLRAETAQLSESHTSVGWVAGAGVEVGFTPHWSAKAEWLFVDLANRNYALTGTQNSLETYLLRMGVNYHF